MTEQLGKQTARLLAATTVATAVAACCNFAAASWLAACRSFATASWLFATICNFAATGWLAAVATAVAAAIAKVALEQLREQTAGTLSTRIASGVTACWCTTSWLCTAGWFCTASWLCTASYFFAATSWLFTSTCGLAC